MREEILSPQDQAAHAHTWPGIVTYPNLAPTTAHPIQASLPVVGFFLPKYYE